MTPSLFPGAIVLSINWADNRQAGHGHIRRVLDDRRSARAPSSRFLRELEDYLPEEEAERVLSVIIDWGRYAELFAYDYEAGIFSTENPGAEAKP